MRATHELGASPGTVARLEPGVRVGLGYDGGLGTWNAAIEPRAGSPVPATNEATLHGLSTSGSISFGWAFVAGRNRVPSPAAGKTALRTADDTFAS